MPKQSAKKPKNILLLSRPFENSNQGTGEQVVAREVYAELSKDKSLRVTKVQRRFFDPYKSITSLLFYDYIVCFLFSVRHLIKPYDLIIFNSPYQAIFTCLFNLRGAMTTCIVHDFFFNENKVKSKFDSYSRLIHPASMFNSKRIITTTIENKYKAKQLYNVSVYVAPLGVRTDEIPQRTEVRPIVGYIGSYTRRKRTEYLLELLKVNNEQAKQHLTLRLAGRIPDEFAEKAKALASKYSTVEIVGEVTEPEKVEFFQSISFLYFPTELEGFGLPLVEAMRYSVVPIVNTDAIIPSIIKDECVQIDDVPQVLDKVVGSCVKYDETLRVANVRMIDSRKFNWADFVSAATIPQHNNMQ